MISGSTALRWFAIAVAAYLVAAAAVWLLQRSFMYFPGGAVASPERFGVRGAREAAFAAADGVRLYGWYLPPPGDAPVVLYFHGNGGNLTLRAPQMSAFAAWGYGALLVSYRGYPGSDGRPSEAGLYADGEGALAFLAGQGIGPERIVLYGESLGSGVVTWLAAQRRFRGLVLESPFTSAADVAAHHYWWLPVHWLMTDRFDSLPRLANIDAPLLVMHGGRDRVTPVAQGHAVLAAARGPAAGHFPQTAGHVDLWAHGGDAAVQDFLASLR